MSINTYRSNVARLRQQIADLENKKSRESQKIARLSADITRIRKSITKYTSENSVRSKQSEIDRKQRDRADTQGKLAKLEKQISDKLNDLNRQLQNLERVEGVEERKRYLEEKKQRGEELRHTRTITSELQKQARIQQGLGTSSFVIDIARLPQKITVLFFAANPLDQGYLQLDEEVHAIEEKIRMSEYRDSVNFVTKWAVRPLDLLQSLNEHDPQIVQFSGHGSENHIAFADQNRRTKLVSIDAMVQLMNAMAFNIKVVIFNTCVSHQQAAAIIQYVDVAIGMSDEISDEGARIFSAHFYSAIGFGRSVQNAFDQGITALGLEGIQEEIIPVLFANDQIDPDKLILVRPITYDNSW